MIMIILFLLFNKVNSNNLINYINSIDIINIKGEINNDLYNKLINYKLTNDKYINIYIKSHGGNLLDAINIIYLIKEFERNMENLQIWFINNNKINILDSYKDYVKIISN